MDIKNFIENQRSELQNKIDMSRYGEEYFEEVIIEGLYDLSADNFTIVTESIGEKFVEIKDKLIKKIKELAIKFKNWVLNLIRNIELNCKTGKMIVNKYKSQIEEQYKKRASKIKIRSKKYKLDVDNVYNVWDTIFDAVEKSIDGHTEELNTYKAEIEITGQGRINVINNNGALNTENLIKVVNSFYYDDDGEVKERLLQDAIRLETIISVLENTKMVVKNSKKSINKYNSMLKEHLAEINNMKEEDFNSKEEFNNCIKNTTTAVKLYTAMGIFFVKQDMRIFKELYKFSQQISKKLLNLKEMKE